MVEKSVTIFSANPRKVESLANTEYSIDFCMAVVESKEELKKNMPEAHFLYVEGRKMISYRDTPKIMYTMNDNEDHFKKQMYVINKEKDEKPSIDPLLMFYGVDGVHLGSQRTVVGVALETESA